MKKLIILLSITVLVTPFLASAQTVAVCQPGDLFNTQTGVRCASIIITPSVCPAGALFNSMTGVPCDSTVTHPVIPITTPNTCPAGDTCTSVTQSSPDSASITLSASGTSSGASQQISLAIPASGQYLGLPILTVQATPSTEDSVLRELTVNIQSSGQGTVGEAYLYQWNPYTGSRLLTTGVINDGSVTFSVPPAFQVALSSFAENTLNIKVDVSGLTQYNDTETITASVVSATAVDSNGQTVNVVGTPEGNPVTVTNSTLPTPTVSVTTSLTDVPYGGSATISWTSTNSTSCILNSSPALLTTAGSESMTNLETSTTYTVTCTGSNGSASGSVTVGVQPLILPPPNSTCAKMMEGLYTNPQQTEECYQEYPITTKG